MTSMATQTQSTQTPTEALSEAGVSIWLDDLSRERITSGGLARLIADRNVVGVTTNPTIFAGALSKGDAYAEQLHALAVAGAYDGRVSIEVAPDLAHDTTATIEQAHALWEKVDRPNVMIKIPATIEGL